MRSKKIFIGVLIIITLALQIGCTAQVQDNGEDMEDNAQHDVQREIMEEFDRLVDSEAGLDEIIGFIDDSIAQLSEEHASIMLDRLEGLQEKNLPVLDEKFYSDQTIQSGINKIYGPGFDMNTVDQMEDGRLKDLLAEAGNTGYRVETAEGMYFPIIDYKFYEKYSYYVTADMNEYIDIMAVESDEVPAKDAALVISWDAILERALRQERFLGQYPDSIKADQIRRLYKKYVSFTLFGLNNTPLFEYDTNTMKDDAKAVYKQAVGSGQDSGYLDTIREYIEVLEKDNFKLTDEVDKYRKNVYGSI
jgi:hypothetical protein